MNGRKLKELRDKHGYSREKFAQLLYVTPSIIESWEEGWAIINPSSGEIDENSGDGYKEVIIQTPETNLSQNETMEIYVVLDLNSPTETLKSLLAEGITNLPTFNIAEITEYTR